MDIKRSVLPYLLSTILLIACSEQPDQATRTAMDGQALFDTFCISCHGAEGQGKFLKGIPPNKYTEKSVPEIMTLIRKGSSGKHSMPEMPFITAQETQKIALYLVNILKQDSD